MASTEQPTTDSTIERVLKVTISIVVLIPISVFVGYGGGLLLTVVAKLGGPDPQTVDGDQLRHRLLAWPDRNRDVMRSDGHADLPLKP